MTIKMFEALNFLETYPALKNKPLNIKTLYKLSKCFDKCTQEQSFYQTQIQELLEKYGQRDENGLLKYNVDNTAILLEPSTSAECNEKANELFNLEIEIDQSILLSEDDLSSIEMDIETFQKIKPFIII